MTRVYYKKEQIACDIADIWAHLTLLATGQDSLLSNSEAAQMAADAYKGLTGQSVDDAINER